MTNSAEQNRDEVLAAKDITKSFGEITVLSDVSLSLYKGDFVSIVGDSGSGKSTLLSILGGIDRPTGGSVSVCGQDITSFSEARLAVLRRTEVGFVFQFFFLAPALTAEENILLPIALSGKNTRAYQKKLDELTEYLGIAAHKKKLPSKLSGGEQQRVALARALIFSPKILLLDEPTGSLDSKSSQSIMELLAKINTELGVTIAQVTHSKEAAEFGNKIVRMKDGRLQEI